MTREEFTNAIFDNHDEWSCPRDYDCDNTDLDECRKCAERQLAKYENNIRMDAIRKFAEWLEDKDYLWQVECTYGEVDADSVTASTIIEEYEKQMKGEKK